MKLDKGIIKYVWNYKSPEIRLFKKANTKKKQILSFSHIKTYCKITVTQHGRLKDEWNGI